ncbi:hypothetical protein SDC9_117283 [bioreactor metagenome]|uniref:Uncharacterized protein n=1 Tax=bioreactor metagenome TaxID=1076179 RepID=A0A645BYZ7_9ZZZZ
MVGVDTREQPAVRKITPIDRGDLQQQKVALFPAEGLVVYLELIDVKINDVQTICVGGGPFSQAALEAGLAEGSRKLVIVEKVLDPLHRTALRDRGEGERDDHYGKQDQRQHEHVGRHLFDDSP